MASLPTFDLEQQLHRIQKGVKNALSHIRFGFKGRNAC